MGAAALFAPDADVSLVAGPTVATMDAMFSVPLDAVKRTSTPQGAK